MSRKWNIALLVLALLLLTGCSLQTIDSLYQVPKRSDEYNNLQSAIDRNLGSRDYCAPQSGENLQTVQMADLDGDGEPEYLLFAKGVAEKPLQILIFRMEDGEYVLADTIQSHGFAFDVVEYARIDDRPGYELIVGCQISNEVARSVSVYSFQDGKAISLMSANYTKFLTCDLNADGRSGLMVLRPGESDEAKGLAELYQYAGDTMERSNQLSLSESADRLKRVFSGRLQGGQSAVFVASAAGENAIITDVFALVDGYFTNISFSAESGTSQSTLRKYNVYAEDIDEDGIMELPALISMRPTSSPSTSSMQYLIRWYSLTPDGKEIDKLYTFHDFLGGWYLTMDNSWAGRVTIQKQGGGYELHLRDENLSLEQKVLTVYYMPGTSSEELIVQSKRFVIYETDSALYAAELEECAATYGITRESVINSFHLIHQDWKTQEVSK
ncbi:MAG: hypothetical protein IJW14_00785 [Oscillospiraceae bacterium]|nr:hypothetical protein [Oscillospiraceae bacterium]